MVNVMSILKLLSVFLLFSFATGSLADTSKSGFYLSTHLAIHKINPVIETNKKFTSPLKQESKFSPAISVGLGYYINDKLRTDLIFEHATFMFNDRANEFHKANEHSYTTGSKILTRKASANSLMLNGYFDFLIKDFYQLFAGAGLGTAKIEERVCHFASGYYMSDEVNYTFPLVTENFCNSNKRNFSYALIFGANFIVNEQVNFELLYKWKDYGKTKYNPQTQVKDNRYKGHHVMAGVRVDL
jgi:opacity protein-like surface antigen